MQATQITTQRPMKPSPWAQPKSIVSVSNPGSSQKAIRPAKIASSTQERRLTQTKSSPGTGFSNGFRAIGSGAGRQRGEHDPLLLARVGAGVTLARAGPALAADVGKGYALGQDVGHPPR